MTAAFCAGETLANTVAFSARLWQFVRRQCRYLAAENDTVHGQADFMANLPRNDIVVAGQDLHLHAGGFQRGKRGGAGLLRSIEVLIRQFAENVDIDVALGKALRILGHAELFEPICNLLHRAKPTRPSLWADEDIPRNLRRELAQFVLSPYTGLSFQRHRN